MKSIQEYLSKMSNYAVLGLGMMGEAVVFDLLENSNAKIFGFEVNSQRREEMDKKFSKYEERFISKHLDLNLNEPVSTNQLITSFSQNEVRTVFGCIDYKFNVYLTKLAISAKVNFLDLGGNPDIVDEQHSMSEQAIEAGITIIPDLGLAPGMANVLAAKIMDKFDELSECHIRVGGLPQPDFKKSILNYQQVFAIRGLTNEYLEEAIVIRDGKKIKVPSMTEVEELRFDSPYGWLEAFQTAGGTSSLPKLYEGKIEELTYKTIRYPGHAQFIQFLIEFDLLSSENNSQFSGHNPREIIEYYLLKNLPKGDPDSVLVRIRVHGKMDGSHISMCYDLIDNYDEKTGFTAMARTTSYPLSIVGQLVHNGVISEKGVIPGEIAVPEAQFLKELENRNIIFKITSNNLD